MKLNHRTKSILKALAMDFGLKIVHAHYLGNDVYGKLLPREKRMLINAKQPRYEQVFTVLHEVGHYFCHVQNQYRNRYPKFLDRNWKFNGLIEFIAKVKRSMNYGFAKTKGKEFEADLWAFCAFIYFARQLGCQKDLLKFLRHHPEKTRTFVLALAGTLYSDVKKFLGDAKTRLKNFPETHLAPALLK